MARNIVAVSNRQTHNRSKNPSKHECARRDFAAARPDVPRDVVRRFVERTTAASGVPLYVEDPGAIDQIAQVLS